MDNLFPNTKINLGNIPYEERDVPFSFPYSGISDQIDCLYATCPSCTIAQFDRIGNSVSGVLKINKVLGSKPAQPTPIDKIIWVEWVDGIKAWVSDPNTKVRKYNDNKKRTQLTISLTILP